VTVDRSALRETLLEAARGAADVVLAAYSEPDLGVEMKGPGDPVTRADREANAYLLERLSAALPGVPIVAEESAPSTFADYPDAPCALFVDPVDGTRELVARNGEFVVMIGFAEAGKPVVGVIVRPTTGEAFVGAVGLGAFVADRAGNRKSLTVGTLTDLTAARCTVSRSRRSDDVNRRLGRLACRELVPRGSAGLKAVAVVTREVDLYAHPSSSRVKLWDACAPDALVRAAGGVLTGASGAPFDYRGALAQGPGLVAGNGALHEAAVRAWRADLAENGP
jgi:3'(2'), 5'-bisphosphate nucleotidase